MVPVSLPPLLTRVQTSIRIKDPPKILPTRNTRAPLTPIPRLMIHRIIQPQTKDIQPIRTPTRDRRNTIENTPQRFPVTNAGAPMTSIPPLMIALIVLTQTKNINAIRAPAFCNGDAVEGTAESFPASERWTPGAAAVAAIPPFVVALVVCAEAEDVKFVRTP
jgi:hypothetical protein